ncbi:MAG: transcription termination/antitermination NusG family protein [Bryobacteraceae bacterium]
MTMPPPPDDRRPGQLEWYAIRIRSKFAQAIASTLEGKGYEVFLPLYTSHKKWSDRIKVKVLPLFPGYLFCRFDAGSRLLPILTTPGVIHIVSAGRQPCPVSEDEIHAVQRIIDSGLAALPWPYLKTGTTVRIDKGPLAGLRGLVRTVPKGFRLVVSVPLLQRSVAVELDRDWVVPVLDQIA